MLRNCGLDTRIESFCKHGKREFCLEAWRHGTAVRPGALCFALSLLSCSPAARGLLPSRRESQVRTRGKLSWLTLALRWLQALDLALLLSTFPNWLRGPAKPPKVGRRSPNGA